MVSKASGDRGGRPPGSHASERILSAAARLIAQGGTAGLTLSAVAAEAQVSRPTLYRWFPTKQLLLGAIAGFEVERFDAEVERVVNGQQTARAKLDAALGFIVSYLDRPDGTSRVDADPAFALQSLADTIGSHVESLAALLGSALEEIPAVRAGALTRQQAVELFLRVAYSHYLVPHSDAGELLSTLRALAGLPIGHPTRG